MKNTAVATTENFLEVVENESIEKLFTEFNKAYICGIVEKIYSLVTKQCGTAFTLHV